MLQARAARLRTARGFTLIELLVVIIILAILAAVVIPKVIGRTEDARKAKAASDISTIDSQLEVYKLDTGSYPDQNTGLAALVMKPGDNVKWNGPYLKNGLPNDPWGKPYQYAIPGQNGKEYDVFTQAPDGEMISNDTK